VSGEPPDDDPTDDGPTGSEPTNEPAGAGGAEPPDVLADTEKPPDPPDEADLDSGEIDRVFSLMDEAVTGDAVEEPQARRLLSVLERAIASPSDTNPETLTELVSTVEELVLDPDDLEAVDVDGVLDVLEEAVSGATAADPENLEDVFAVLEEGLTDPTGLDPEDVERFRAGLEGALVDLTGSDGGDLGGLFSASGAAGAGPREVGGDDEEVPDTFRIARVATAMTRRATGYSAESGIRAGTRMAYAAATSESPADLLTETRAIALDELQRAGIDVGDEQSDWLEAHEEELADRRPLTAETLRERGERLLSKSAEVGRDETFHPAYPSILDELAADEARILRLLATEGTQAYMDVRDRGYIPFTTEPVAEHMTMVGTDAGCRRPERTPTYLQNLERLALVAFSQDPIDDLKRYQVLEAQPHIEAARESARRPKTVYGRLYLTDLGVGFCEACLPVRVDLEHSRARFRRESGE
jgi:hypothetical protein